jgi:hypothetical protein
MLKRPTDCTICHSPTRKQGIPTTNRAFADAFGSPEDHQYTARRAAAMESASNTRPISLQRNQTACLSCVVLHSLFEEELPQAERSLLSITKRELAVYKHMTNADVPSYRVVESSCVGYRLRVKHGYVRHISSARMPLSGIPIISFARPVIL